MKPASSSDQRLELLMILGRNTQEVSDHRYGQRVREVPDQVHLSGRGGAMSRSRSTIPAIRARRASIERAVNARPSALRSRVCTGGSVNTTQSPT